METILPADAINSVFSLSAVGFIEGEETICIDSGERIFTVEVQSKRTRDIGPSGSEFVLAFLHFHMPTWRKVSTKQLFLILFTSLCAFTAFHIVTFLCTES